MEVLVKQAKEKCIEAMTDHCGDIDMIEEWQKYAIVVDNLPLIYTLEFLSELNYTVANIYESGEKSYLLNENLEKYSELYRAEMANMWDTMNKILETDIEWC